MKIKKIKLLEERITELEKTCAKQFTTLSELLEYLMHVDKNFETDPGNFNSWHEKLMLIRHKERVEQEIRKAKRVLAQHGYVVAASEQDMDAARVRKWVDSKTEPDDDIPF